MSSMWKQSADDHSAGSRLYRDRENGWIFGVCAGLADRYEFSTMVVRVLAVLSLMLFPVPAALAYLVATLLMPRRPLIYRGTSAEQDFWRRHKHRDHWGST